jgi:hypothetical protein
VAAPKEEKIELQSVTIDGQTVYVFTDKDEAEALVRMARNSIFMSELQRRGQKVFIIGGAVTAFLFFMSQWWPAIDAVVRVILKGVPNSG